MQLPRRVGQFAQINGKNGARHLRAAAFAQSFCWREACS